MSDLMMLGSVSRNETAFISDVMLLLPQDDGENKKKFYFILNGLMKENDFCCYLLTLEIFEYMT